MSRKQQVVYYGSYDAVPLIETPSASRREVVCTPELTAYSIRPRTISTIQLVILVYFWTCGGPYGVEPAVGAGGVAMTILTVAFILLMWALPQAMLSAELSLMMDVNGGNVIWAQHAFGDMGGFINAGCFLACCLASQAMTVITFIQYLKLALSFDITVEWVLRVTLVVACTLINIWGLKYLSKLSWVLFVVIFSPFVALNIAIFTLQPPITVNFGNVFNFPNYEQIHFGVLISTVVWGLGGYDYVGSIAGEIKGGKRAYVIGILATFPLNMVNYLYPLTLCYMIDNDNSHWGAGFFTKFVAQNFPFWLTIWMVVSCILCNFCALASNMSQLSWTVWAMGKGKKDNVALHRYLPYFVSWSWSREYQGTITEIPLMAILLIGVIVLALSALQYSFISQIFLVVRSANVMCEYASLIRLRYTEPDKRRPFTILGGKLGAWLLVVPTLSICTFSMYSSDSGALITGSSCIAFIILCYPVKRLWVFVTHKTYEILSNVASI